MDFPSDIGAVLRAALAILPVFAFLAGLLFIDSYKLVRLRSVVASVLVGFIATAIAYPLQTWLIELTGVGFTTFSRYLAPPIEELLKALFIILLIRTNRVGFLVDAAIHGFAVGAGFSLVENLYYLESHPEMGAAAWVVRGFGTAIMHGGGTAIFAVVSKMLIDRRSGWGVIAPWLLAAIIHSAFNHLTLPPIAMTLILVVALPPLFLVIFSRSERATSRWLGTGFDIDQELLRVILSDDGPDTRIAAYLGTLRRRFPGEVVADMLCYLRLHAELSIRAKGILMMRQAGFKVKPDPEAAARLEEFDYLRTSIGVTALLAVAPFIQRSGRDRWQLSLLRDDVRSAGRLSQSVADGASVGTN